MDYPIFPFEILEYIGEFTPDSRGLYLTCSRLYDGAPDREHWESRGDDRIRLHPVKLPTVLHMWDFSKHGNLSMVRKLYLVEHDYISCNLISQLEVAAYNGHFDVVKYLHGELGANIKNWFSQAIVDAAANGHLNIVMYLHEHGASVNSSYCRALQFAAMKGYLEVVKYLHQHGAKISLFDYEYIKYFITGKKYKEVADYLLESGAITA